jgi:hypothetical protein
MERAELRRVLTARSAAPLSSSALSPADSRWAAPRTRHPSLNISEGPDGIDSRHSSTDPQQRRWPMDDETITIDHEA